MAHDFRADQVGSLLRPRELLEAQAAHAEGRIGQQELVAAENAAVLAALDMQREVGIDVFTDGEYRRWRYSSTLTDAVEGFVAVDVPQAGHEWQGEGVTDPSLRTFVVGAKLRQTRRLSAHEAAFLQQHAPGPFKITVPSPNHFASGRHWPGSAEQHYPTRGDLLRDVTDIIRKEVHALVGEGVPYVQIDAPTYTHYADPRLVARMREQGIDPDQALTEAIAADNACLQDVARDGVVLAIHLCRGNSRSRWLAEGGYDPIAEKLFQGLQVDRFLLEYDSERAGGFEPLRFVPRGKTVVLGLVTTKQGALESPDELRRRIDEASRYVPLENLALSPQCGFASSLLGNLLSWDDQRRKLELVVETARKVWS